jgi:hypothetical protein
MLKIERVASKETSLGRNYEGEMEIKSRKSLNYNRYCHCNTAAIFVKFVYCAQQIGRNLWIIRICVLQHYFVSEDKK